MFMNSTRPKQLGFTLIELMVVVVILAIISTIGIPNLTRFLERNRVVGVTNDLLGGIQFSRSEAARLNTTAVICPGPTGSQEDCSVGSWNDGWRVMRNGNRLRVADTINPGITITGPESGITYNSAGTIGDLDQIDVNASDLSFTIASENFSRCINVWFSGRAAVIDCSSDD